MASPAGPVPAPRFGFGLAPALPLSCPPAPVPAPVPAPRPRSRPPQASRGWPTGSLDLCKRTWRVAGACAGTCDKCHPDHFTDERRWCYQEFNKLVEEVKREGC